MLQKKKEIKRRTEGIIVETLRNALFRVKLLKEDREILAYLAGKLRLYRIKILPGDKVLVELSPYDPEKGRIIYRL